MKAHHLFLVMAIASNGCATDLDRLDEEFGEVSREKIELVKTALKKAGDQPQASGVYTEWVAAITDLNNKRSLAGNESLDANVRELLLKQLAPLEAAERKLREQAELDHSLEIYFIDHEKQNATTIVLGPGNSARIDAEFRNRNRYTANWISDGPSEVSITEAEAWYRRMAKLNYLLVIREVDIAKPEFKGVDSQGRKEYARGAIHVDAFLIDLESQKVITSFEVVAENKQSPSELGGVDILLPVDEGSAIESLTTRLYETAHAATAASLAEMSDNVHSDFRHERGLLFQTLERN